MRRIILGTIAISLLLIGYGFLTLTALGQSGDPATAWQVVESRSRYYEQACQEISGMLDGKSPVSIRRAVFLAEWAYLDGNLDFGDFCRGIDTAVAYLYRFLSVNELGRYKTGKNLALTEYFFRPYSGNGYRPFTYDFQDTGGETDFTKQFVSKVMRTHTGQCRSLPMYYKVLAETFGADASIAYAPAHVFIRYRNEDHLYPEEWVNVELTTHQIVPESWYREYFEISDAAIESKVYLSPLTDRETVAAQLADLALGYLNKYGVYDDFIRICAEKSLEHYPPNPKACVLLGKSLEAALLKHLQGNGYREDDYVRQIMARSKALFERLKALGWQDMDEQLQKKLEAGNEQGRLRQEKAATPQTIPNL